MEDRPAKEPTRQPKEFRHPYDNRELWDKKIEPVVAFSDEFYGQVHSLWRQRKGQVTPEEVKDRFEKYKSQSHLRGWVEDLSLWNVWLSATYKADNVLWGGPHTIRDPGYHAQLDQVATLIENAMDLAGHRPPEATPS